MIPPAAAAVIEAALDDAARAGVRDPHAAAQRAVRALERAGWAIAPSGAATGRQAGVQGRAHTGSAA